MTWQILVSNHAHPFFSELIQAIQRSLKSIGFDSYIIHNLNQIKDKGYLFIIGVHEFDLTISFKNLKILGLQTEQLPQKNSNSEFTENNWKRVCNTLSKCHFIFDFYQGNIEFLQQQGYKANLFIIGYDSYFETPTKCPQIYDVCFIGAVSPRREYIINQLKKFCRVCPTYFAFGAQRNNLIYQSKICLNIHVDSSDFYEKLRVEQTYLSNKRFVISENCLYHDPLVNQDHLVFKPYGGLVESVRYYLKHPELRAKIAENGYNYLRNHLDFHTNFINLLKLVRIIY